jgi:hypothetical protein
MPDLKIHDMKAPELIGFTISIFDLALNSNRPFLPLFSDWKDRASPGKDR